MIVEPTQPPKRVCLTTRGLWRDVKTGQIYDTNLAQAITEAGGSNAQYQRCWKALRRKKDWPDDAPVQPATKADVNKVLRSIVYEVEVVLIPQNVKAVEEMVLHLGGWLRRISIKKLPRARRTNAYTCVWLISGLTDLEWLRKIVEVGCGRITEVDEGNYRRLYRTG